MFTYLISFINFITHYSQLKVNKFLLNVKTEFPSQTCIWLFILHSLYVCQSALYVGWLS